jgi:hypothetical protein
MISTWKGAALKGLVFAASVVLGVAAYLYYARATPVLFRYVEAGNPTKEPAVAVFNPFRDREPESSAETFLAQLKAGECERTMAALSRTAQSIQETCDREGRYPLTAWRLKNRTDEPHRVRMYYQVGRNNSNNLQGQVWITVEKDGEQWQVTRYESIY